MDFESIGRAFESLQAQPGLIAQLAEQRTLNPFVVGSIPTGPMATFPKTSTCLWVLAELLHHHKISIIPGIKFTHAASCMQQRCAK